MYLLRILEKLSFLNNISNFFWDSAYLVYFHGTLHKLKVTNNFKDLYEYNIYYQVILRKIIGKPKYKNLSTKNIMNKDNIVHDR